MAKHPAGEIIARFEELSAVRAPDGLVTLVGSEEATLARGDELRLEWGGPWAAAIGMTPFALVRVSAAGERTLLYYEELLDEREHLRPYLHVLQGLRRFVKDVVDATNVTAHENVG